MFECLTNYLGKTFPTPLYFLIKLIQFKPPKPKEFLSKISMLCFLRSFLQTSTSRGSASVHLTSNCMILKGDTYDLSRSLVEQLHTSIVKRQWYLFQTRHSNFSFLTCRRVGAPDPEKLFEKPSDSNRKCKMEEDRRC